MREVQVSAWISRIPAPSRTVQRALAIAALVTQAGVATGGAVVRVTGSGLGCPTWPRCAPGSLVPIADPTRGQLHQWIEFGNRLFGVAVGVIAVLIFLAALLNRPRRRRYVLLALTMPLGVVVQAVLGGLAVLMKLDWWTISLHFLPSTLLVWLGMMLVVAVDEGDEPARLLIPRPLRSLQVTLAVVLALVLGAGTLVTAAGPHAGDAATPRLDLPVANLAQFHSDLVFLLVGLIIAVGFALRAAGCTPRLWRAYHLLATAVVAQGALGMVQYFLGVPDALVALHEFGSFLVTAAMAWFWCAARDRGPVPAVPGTAKTRAAQADVPSSTLAA